MAYEIIASIVGGVVSGFLGGVFSNDLRNLMFGARLDLDLTERGSRMRTHHTDGPEAIYIRVRVRNIGAGMSIAKSCRAFLTKIEKQTSGCFANTEYTESCQLFWSAQGDGSKPLDIPTGVEQYIDVLRSNSESTQLFQTTVTPLFVYQNIFSTAGMYRLEVMVSGDGIKPIFYRIIVTHTGRWDEVTVDKERGISATAWTG